MDPAARDHVLKIMFHPMLVHFPIAFYFLELFLLVLWVVKNDPYYQKFSFFSFKIGYAFMLVAMVAGLKDAGGFGNIRGAVQRHVAAALSVFLLYTVRAIFYWVVKGKQKEYRFAILAGALIGNAVVAYAGFLGGLLVYD